MQMLKPNCSSSFYHDVHLLIVVYVHSVLRPQPAAAEANKSIDFKGLRVYGLLTNLIQFKFYSYDPSTNQFCFDEIIVINNRRATVFADKINGTDLSPLL